LKIGNDIVDLKYERSHPHHPGFPRRVLNDEEYKEYQSGGFDYLWHAWSAKESAYKAMRQIDPKTRFIPRWFHYNQKDSTVTNGHQTLPVKFQETTDYLYCEAGHPQMRRIKSVDSIEDQSRSVRDLARSMLGQDVKFEKGPGGEPLAIKKGVQLDCTLSFTHHGSYLAVAIGLET
jgi:phosphopantetheinyl transferase (holo-ACP synthase)